MPLRKKRGSQPHGQDRVPLHHIRTECSRVTRLGESGVTRTKQGARGPSGEKTRIAPLPYADKEY